MPVLRWPIFRPGRLPCARRRRGLQAVLDTGEQTSQLWLWPCCDKQQPGRARVLAWGLASEPAALADHWPGSRRRPVSHLVLRLPPGYVQSVQIEAPQQLAGALLERHIQSRLQSHLGATNGPFAFDFTVPDTPGVTTETTRQLQVFALPWAQLTPLLHALAYARLPLDAIRPAVADIQTVLEDTPGDTDSLLARWGAPLDSAEPEWA